MRDIKFKLSQPQKGEKLARVFLGGDLSVNCLDELLPKIKTIEKDYSEIEININDVSVFDIATMQLLVSMQKTAEKHKKTVKFKIDLPKETIEILENTGLLKVLKKL